MKPIRLEKPGFGKKSPAMKFPKVKLIKFKEPNTMTQEHKHTPTPWRLHDRKVHILNQHGSVIAQVNLIQKHIRTEDDITEMHANADFIVTACNAHEELVKTGKELLESLVKNPAEIAVKALAFNEALSRAGVKL